jgi:hypothetical protein
MVFVLMLFLTVYAGAHFYTARRLFQCIGPRLKHVNVKQFAGVYVFLAAAMIMGYLPLPFGISGVMRFIGMYWLGICMYLLMFFLAADLILLLGKITRAIPASMLGHARLYLGTAAILLTAATVSYGIYNANRIKTVYYELQLRDAVLDDMKIVLVSDLHLGEVNSERNLERTVLAVNRLNPDIVCLVGDIFNDNYYAIRDPDRAAVLLKSIEAKYGVYAALGNHDGGPTFNKMIDLLKRSGVTPLKDEYRIIDGRLALFGRLDSRPIGGFGGLERRDVADAIASVGAETPVVIMDHNPANIMEYGKGTDLIISGHTHKGQMFPGNLITRAINVVDYGHYQKDAGSPHVIVTSGASTWGPPMRIGTNNEIASILLR